MADWKNPADIEFCYQVVWCTPGARCKASSATATGPSSRCSSRISPTRARRRASTSNCPDYIENAFELLDEPGEWYLDRPAKTVYYLPKPGEDMTKAKVIAPAVEKLVELRGTLDQPVENIQFEGITFAEAAGCGRARSVWSTCRPTS